MVKRLTKLSNLVHTVVMLSHRAPKAREIFGHFFHLIIVSLNYSSNEFTTDVNFHLIIVVNRCP